MVQQFNRVSVHGVRAIPDPWERKRLACPAAGVPPLPIPPPTGGGQVGGLNDYVTFLARFSGSLFWLTRVA
jgi:hypothetical protein